jgi:hypothetical protein
VRFYAFWYDRLPTLVEEINVMVGMGHEIRLEAVVRERTPGMHGFEVLMAMTEETHEWFVRYFPRRTVLK